MPDSLPGPSAFADFPLPPGDLFGAKSGGALPNERHLLTRHRPSEQFWHIYHKNFCDGEDDLEFSEQPRKFAGNLAS